jgi:hypothetical protein
MLVDVFNQNITQQDLSSQIGNAFFQLDRPFHLGTLLVFWNGLKQTTADVEVLSPTTFRLNQNVITDDSIMVVFKPC